MHQDDLLVLFYVTSVNLEVEFRESRRAMNFIDKGRRCLDEEIRREERVRLAPGARLCI